MKKRGSVLKIIGIIFIVLIIILLAVGIYFYNFYVFKTVRICIGEANNIMVSCNTDSDCAGFFKGQALDFNLSDAPIFLQEKFEDVIDTAVYCNETCFVRNIRGINPKTQELEMLDGCNAGEVEIKADIQGRDGLEIWNWIKSRQA